MYEDLIKKLRYCGNAVSCLHCPYWEGCSGSKSKEDLTDAADAIEELICEVADEHNARLDAEERQRWIPVTERLPEEKINPYTHDFEPIICSTNFGDVRVYKYGTPIGWDEPHFWNGAGIVDWYVTHWMPLPEAPKDGE